MRQKTYHFRHQHGDVDVAWSMRFSKCLPPGAPPRFRVWKKEVLVFAPRGMDEHELLAEYVSDLLMPMIWLVLGLLGGREDYLHARMDGDDLVVYDPRTRVRTRYEIEYLKEQSELRDGTFPCGA